ncbi:carboxymuconolactone decarboxylase family protein [Allopusillimonas soli]|uniref:Carboxymuconolactone decarboxylase family protein n=1 Tax=Allopusillimonas soli TaxID=659016 RepID=A0A853FIL9_9BURK|nr:carboxymuconolactone decarboxylase family protein [Allopusillimonas soli]NYT37816.1 carboxymuconolactone decarboxylase family protein [Allopusillimonas soli]TEA73724.1 carboxymuconolactone decarboxylase family protein [Allopusillimonas soli]
MWIDWKSTLSNLRKAGSALAEKNPPLVKAYQGLNKSLGEGTALDAKTRELIALAVAVTTRCDGCISSHSAAARQAGATAEEVAEALGTAIALNAGAAYVYSARAMEAFNQFSE